MSEENNPLPSKTCDVSDPNYPAMLTALASAFELRIQNIKKVYLAELQIPAKGFCAIRSVNGFVLKEEPTNDYKQRQLFDVFMDALPPTMRQHYACSNCAGFINKYGALVYIDDAGKLESVYWDPSTVPESFVPVIEAMRNEVLRTGKIKRVFGCARQITGQPVTENSEWRHFSMDFSKAQKGFLTAKDAHFIQEQFRIFHKYIREMSLDVLLKTVDELKMDVIPKGDVWARPLEEIIKAKEIFDNTKGPARDVGIWNVIEKAGDHILRIPNSAIGEYTKMLHQGDGPASCRARYCSMVASINYRRPKSEASAGNIKQANEIFEELGITKSLERRHARLDELLPIWSPATVEVEEEKSEGVFDHLLKKEKAASDHSTAVSGGDVSWTHFVKKIMPHAIEMSWRAPAKLYGHSYVVLRNFVTATHPDAPPIIKWDSLENRNPINSYTYEGPQETEKWNLVPGQIVKVTAVVLGPSGRDQDVEESRLVTFIVEGAKDISARALGLFPSDLIDELYRVRKTIENHSNVTRLTGEEEASAAGPYINKISDARTFRVLKELYVKTKAGFYRYNITSW